jgi:hypothetical protein
MSSRSSRRNEIGGAIGDQLRAIYDEVLNEPIADRFFELLDQLETDSKLVAHQKNTQKFAPFQSTARISRNAPGCHRRATSKLYRRQDAVVQIIELDLP